MAYAIYKPRRGTPNEWSTHNPILREGEMGVEACVNGIGKGICKFKFGDGVTRWNDLPYAVCPESYLTQIDTNGLVTKEEYNDSMLIVASHTDDINGLKNDVAAMKEKDDTYGNDISALNTKYTEQNLTLSNINSKADRAIDQSVSTYIHSKTDKTHNITGSGNNIRFYATADWNSGDVLTINGVAAEVYNNECERVEADELFKSGATVMFIKTSTDNKCFIVSGVSKSYVDNVVNNISNTPDLLWENPSPEKVFKEQLITIPTLPNYSWYVLEFYGYNESITVDTAFIMKNGGTILTGDLVKTRRYRRIKIYDTTFDVGGARMWKTYNSTAEDEDNGCIPLRLYGFK